MEQKTALGVALESTCTYNFGSEKEAGDDKSPSTANRESVAKYFEEKCIGKQDCNFVLNDLKFVS